MAGPPHDHGHGHGHAHSHAPSRRRRPPLARRSRSALILAFMVVEVVAGLLADSLALLSDAAHMLTDAGSIALALVAARLAARPPGGGFTYGLGRAEILSAQVNGATLLVLAGVIAWEAVQRIARPARGGRGASCSSSASLGAGVNVGGGMGAVARRAALAQRRGRPRARARRPLRVARRGARRPAGASSPASTGGRLVALLVAALMVRSGFALLGQATRVLLEAAPRGIDPDAVGHALAAHPGRQRGARPARLGGHVGLHGALGARARPGGRGLPRPPRASSSTCSPSASGSSTPRCRSSTRPPTPARHRAARPMKQGILAARASASHMRLLLALLLTHAPRPPRRARRP